jgi:hypothetical protein
MARLQQARACEYAPVIVMLQTLLLHSIQLILPVMKPAAFANIYMLEAHLARLQQARACWSDPLLQSSPALASAADRQAGLQQQQKSAQLMHVRS